MTLERFHFDHAGKTYDMPLYNQLKVGVQVDLLEAVDIVATRPHLVMKVLIEIAGEGAEAVRDMNNEEFMELFGNWMKATPAVSGK